MWHTITETFCIWKISNKGCRIVRYFPNWISHCLDISESSKAHRLNTEKSGLRYQEAAHVFFINAKSKGDSPVPDVDLE